MNSSQGQRPVQLQLINLWIVATLGPALLIVVGLPGILPGPSGRDIRAAPIILGLTLLCIRAVTRFGVAEKVSADAIEVAGVLGQIRLVPGAVVGGAILGPVAMSRDAEWTALFLRPGSTVSLLVIVVDVNGHAAAARLLRSGKPVVGAVLKDGRVQTRRARREAEADDFYSR